MKVFYVKINTKLVFFKIANLYIFTFNGDFTFLKARKGGDRKSNYFVF